MPSRLYTLTSSAESDLSGIIRYTLEKWGLAQARKYADQLETAFADLARGKIKGRECDSVLPGALKHLIGSHVVFYTRAEKKHIHILRILHERMDIPRQLEGF